jgi:hypothetical protein
MRFNIIIAILLIGLMLTCENDQEDTTIDPCPGWPCFQVGNEWMYETNDCCYDYTIIELACSTVTINNRHYRLIKRQEVYDLIGTFDYEYYVRTSGDTLFHSSIDGHESIVCIYGQPVGEYLNFPEGNPENPEDSTLLMVSLGNKNEYIFNDSLYDDGQAYTDYNTYYQINTAHNYKMRDKLYSKQFGLIGLSYFEHSEYLVSFKPGSVE